eukprot:Colp12_sorted_trinity150504_noHs@20649
MADQEQLEQLQTAAFRQSALFEFGYQAAHLLSENFSVSMPKTANTILSSALKADRSVFIVTEFDPFRHFDDMKLTEAAKRMQFEPNAGGNSVESEVLSFEVLHKCFNARLDKTEMQIRYWPLGGSITDYTAFIGDIRLGVSVTRAMKYRGVFTYDDAMKIMMKKLRGINISSNNLLEPVKKQILHIWATSDRVANILADAHCDIPEEVKKDSVVLVTVTKAKWIFTNSAKAATWELT